MFLSFSRFPPLILRAYGLHLIISSTSFVDIDIFLSFATHPSARAFFYNLLDIYASRFLFDSPQTLPLSSQHPPPLRPSIDISTYFSFNPTFSFPESKFVHLFLSRSLCLPLDPYISPWHFFLTITAMARTRYRIDFNLAQSAVYLILLSFFFVLMRFCFPVGHSHALQTFLSQHGRHV